MMEIEWTETALDDMLSLDKGIARRIKLSAERFTETGAGNVKRLQGIDPPEFRLRVGDYRVRSASATAAKLTADVRRGLSRPIKPNRT
jgi:mRNA-degrading endonuclease RelE of RelBE toxin-antitoxin system